MLKTESPKEAILLSKNMPVAYKNYILLNGIVVIAFVWKRANNYCWQLFNYKTTWIWNKHKLGLILTNGKMDVPSQLKND